MEVYVIAIDFTMTMCSLNHHAIHTTVNDVILSKKLYKLSSPEPETVKYMTRKSQAYSIACDIANTDYSVAIWNWKDVRIYPVLRDLFHVCQCMPKSYLTYNILITIADDITGSISNWSRWIQRTKNNTILTRYTLITY